MPETRYVEEFQNSQLVRRTPYEVSDAQVEREQAGPQVRAALTRLAQIAQRAGDLSTQGANLNQADLKELAGAIADLARIQRRLILHLVGE